jgi:CheY-like chemotaxis protein
MQVSVLITDQMMPGMNGMELGARARTLRPGLPMILISGYASSLEEEHVMSKGFSMMMMKPLTAGQLSQAVFSALKIDGGGAELRRH